MSAVPERDDLHRLVDRLTLEQTRALRAVALHLVGDVPPEAPETATSGGVVRRLSFAGAGQADPGLAASSADILRRELGDPDRP